jgi:hypothetical protein
MILKKGQMLVSIDSIQTSSLVKHSESVNAPLDFAEEMARAALINPAKGALQLAEHVAGLPDTVISSDKKYAPESNAGRMGASVGSALPFVAASLATLKFMPLNSAKLLNVAVGAGTGFGYDLLFQPVTDANASGYWGSKFRDAGVAALTVGTMSSFPTLKMTTSKAENILKGAGMGLVSGFAGGAVNAEAKSLLEGKGLANTTDVLESGLAFGTVGLGFGAASGYFKPVKLVDSRVPADLKWDNAINSAGRLESHLVDADGKIKIIERPNYDQVRQDFLKEVKRNFNREEQARINDALSVMEDAHEGQVRKVKIDRPDIRDPYAIHPMRVALILMNEAKQNDANTVIAAILHDVVEDSKGRYTLPMMEQRFGPEVATSLKYLTKPAANSEMTAQQLHDYHSALETTAPKATLNVKLADRLDNIRETLWNSNTRFQKKYLNETETVYIPIAQQQADPFFADSISQVCDRLKLILK